MFVISAICNNPNLDHQSHSQVLHYKPDTEDWWMRVKTLDKLRIEEAVWLVDLPGSRAGQHLVLVEGREMEVLDNHTVLLQGHQARMVVDKLVHSVGGVELPRMTEEYLAVIVEVLAVGERHEDPQSNSWRVSNPCHRLVVFVGCLGVAHLDKVDVLGESYLVVLEGGRMMYSFPVEGKGHTNLAVTVDGQHGG